MRSVAVVFCSVLILFSFSHAQATIIHVPDDSSTIQGGINGAVDGDTVLVAPGTYYEHINFNGHNVILGSLFLTTDDTSYISTTVIDGDSSGRVVVFENEEDSTAVIIGFTIQNGYDYFLLDYGAGIYCSNSNPIISSNTIRWNFAYDSGGGIYCYNSDPTIINNTISGNSAGDQGGGIGCYNNSNPTIINNTISGNSAGWGGGGVSFFYYSNARLEENVIISNSCDIWAGGIQIYYNSSPVIVRNMIQGNSGDLGGGVSSFSDGGYNYPILLENVISENIAGTGGGIYLRGGYGGSGENRMCITNCTIVNNSAVQGEIMGFGGHYGPSITVVVNTIFWKTFGGPDNLIYLESGDEVQLTYSDIKGGWEGEGNIDCDPMFCDPDTGNYYLIDSSCCVGAGCDSLGNPDSTVHIGAFGVGCGVYLCGDVNNDGIINIGDVVYLISYLYRGGTAPVPQTCAGDINSDDIVNIGDVVYLIGYLYRGDPPPDPLCCTPPWVNLYDR